MSHDQTAHRLGRAVGSPYTRRYGLTPTTFAVERKLAELEAGVAADPAAHAR